MTQARTFVASIVLASIWLATNPTELSTDPRPALAGPPTDNPAPTQEARSSEHPTVTWARARFAIAWLTLPDIRIFTFDSIMDCDGHVGYYFPDRNELHLCRIDKPSVLHELAHAWADLNLTAEDRAAFTRYRKLTNWNDHDEPWRQRATEHAAEILTWALMDRETTLRWIDDDGTESRRLLRIDQSSPQELAAAYRFLTNRWPPFPRFLAGADAQSSTSPELLRAG